MASDEPSMNVFTTIQKRAESMGKEQPAEPQAPQNPVDPNVKTLTMTLARALTYKKRVAERLKQVETDIQGNNSIVTGQEREANIEELMTERGQLINHMIDLKLTILKANTPIQRLILEIGEMKSENDFLRRIPTTHGMKANSYAYDSSQPATISYNSVIRKSDIDDIVKRSNSRIDKWQEQIDTHNHSTSITIEDIGILS